MSFKWNVTQFRHVPAFCCRIRWRRADYVTESNPGLQGDDAAYDVKFTVTASGRSLSVVVGLGLRYTIHRCFTASADKSHNVCRWPSFIVSCRSKRLTWVSGGSTSHSTLYRSFRGQCLQARWLNQQRLSTEGSQLATEINFNLTRTTPPCYSMNCSQPTSRLITA